MEDNINPNYILQIATGLWTSNLLLTALEFDLFTTLGNRSMTAQQLGEVLAIHPRVTYDFFDALVALKLLDRDGEGLEGQYKNTPETAVFLAQTSPHYIGDLPEMFYSRIFGFWKDLANALKTGQPRNKGRNNGQSFWHEICEDEDKLSQFHNVMSGLQAHNFNQLAKKFDFSSYKTVSDIGGALALLSCILGDHHKHLSFNTFDLPAVAPHVQKHIDAVGMAERIKIVSGDFFEDDLPQADVITMGNVLHNWNLEKKKILIQKAYNALPDGGVLIAIENLIDDARRENIFGLLMSLQMLMIFGDAFDYTGDDFRQWCSEVGFQRFNVINLAGSTSAAIAYK